MVVQIVQKQVVVQKIQLIQHQQKKIHIIQLQGFHQIKQISQLNQVQGIFQKCHQWVKLIQ